MEIIWCNYYFSQSKYIRHWSNFILLQTWRHVRIIFLWLNIDAYAISIKKTWGSVYYRWYVLGTLHVNHLLLFQTRLKFIIRYLFVRLLIWFCATSLVFWCKTKIGKWESESWQRKKSITKEHDQGKTSQESKRLIIAWWNSGMRHASMENSFLTTSALSQVHLSRLSLWCLLALAGIMNG
jgi:hypothetical protein